ncbi:MAE_28990/MAE_18760 family HEPN-like nuclease [Salinarimonas soli]|uniref:MAE-28990/MAE-18760-like HEPN domain-containing protein n=1 Tax=Salinarimonas soli TaxID=1638099 RepID=A0A5B2VBN1_9HYPH|nr:MAE_28990/MAE_18760 family HEPN-like nuclease [Salinarimonas soli]KAA2235587.1 hypothetical protein F0L46_18985 [Salinarimonas soli]
MHTFVVTFQDRLAEIDDYLLLLDAIEDAAREGPPRLGAAGPAITATQQKMLLSSVYLQLYNLVESTASGCIDAVCDACRSGAWLPRDLSAALRREWVRYIARTHEDLNHENRLHRTVELVEALVDALPISRLSVEKSGGSWDDGQIESIVKRMGFELRITRDVYRGIKRAVRDDKGPMKFVADLRNQLAHGSISFVECGDGATVGDLRDLRDRIGLYLGEMVDAFAVWIDAHEFLVPERRPGPA